MLSSDSGQCFNFGVDPHIVVANQLGRGYLANMYAKRNPEQREEILRRSKVNLNSPFTTFIDQRKDLVQTGKFIHNDGSNIFDTLARVYTRVIEMGIETEDVKRTIQMEYDLSDEDLEKYDFDGLIEGLKALSKSDEVTNVIDYTNSYKNGVEKVWKTNQDFILSNIARIVGKSFDMKPKKTVHAYVTYPSFSTNKASQIGNGNSCILFGKDVRTDATKVLGELAYQLIKVSYLPYKNGMTSTRKNYHRAFLKFLAAKETFSKLSGKPAVEMVTDGESPEYMAKVYPYWLGYKYRNADREGRTPEACIAGEIARDKAYVESLDPQSKKASLYAAYDFENYDPKKIAEIFVGKRGMTPYEFNLLPFENQGRILKAKAKDHSKDLDEK